MRTSLFLLAGLLLAGASFILGRLFQQTYPQAASWATSLFIALWFALAGANLVAGVTKAGPRIVSRSNHVLSLARRETRTGADSKGTLRMATSAHPAMIFFISFSAHAMASLVDVPVTALASMLGRM